MERRIAFSEGEFYHAYNRGVDKRKIFYTSGDYDRFLALLYLSNDSGATRLGNELRRKSVEEILMQKQGEPLVAIGAYCLMPNHFHLLLTPVAEGGISRFMLKLQTAYSMYFNLKNDRTGALFQGAFKAQHIDTDVYLQYLYAYIHLNPASIVDPSWKKGKVTETKRLKTFVEKYPYSSRGAYISDTHNITNPKPFPAEFNTAQEFSDMLDSWIDLREQVIPEHL